MLKIGFVGVALCVGLAGCSSGESGSGSATPSSDDVTEPAPTGSDEAPIEARYVLDHDARLIDGTDVSLRDYEGRVVMLVNTASKCGLTKQYAALQSVYETYEARGFVVLGFPANNFMGQEPGTNEEIATFCSDRFDVSFPMFEKISVKGDDQHPLYAELTGFEEPLGGTIPWNFTKFVVDRKGNVVARFGPRTKPDDPKVIAQIETLLSDDAG